MLGIDTITHTLFGLGLYGSVKDKEHMEKKERMAYLITAVGASQIPDIDVISKLWDTEGLYQMWHRGITHSIFLTPFWALLFYFICYYFYHVKSSKIFLLGFISVVIHNTSDLFNAWGTGYLEPFSSIRLTFGTVPIIDFVVWIIFLVAWIFARRRKNNTNKQVYPIYRIAFCLVAVHFLIQTVQGLLVVKPYYDKYDQVALSANFIPWDYHVIAKKDGKVDIFSDNLFQPSKKVYELESKEDANLDYLFSQNPKAKTLYEWSPFVVIVDDGEKLGVYDPRFYRNGQSFLFEYIEMNHSRE